MATRKGINISGSYMPHPIYYMPCSYMYFVLKKNERSERIVFYILFKTQRPSGTVFLFGVIESNSSQRLHVRIKFLKTQI